MGVLQCDRPDCGNIMCKRLSDKHGYICDECFEKLVRLGVQTDVHTFMETTPTIIDEDEAREIFEREVRET